MISEVSDHCPGCDLSFFLGALRTFQRSATTTARYPLSAPAGEGVRSEIRSNGSKGRRETFAPAPCSKDPDWWQQLHARQLLRFGDYLDARTAVPEERAEVSVAIPREDRRFRRETVCRDPRLEIVP